MYRIPDKTYTTDDTLTAMMAGQTFSPKILMDAMRAVCHLPLPGENPVSVCWPVGRDGGGTLTYVGHTRIWTTPEAADVVTAVFGKNAHDRIRSAVAIYRTTAVDNIPDHVIMGIGFIVWAGATYADMIAWESYPHGGNSAESGLGMLCTAYYLSRWGYDVLTGLLDARFTFAELYEIYENGVLPAVETVRLMTETQRLVLV